MNRLARFRALRRIEGTDAPRVPSKGSALAPPPTPDTRHIQRYQSRPKVLCVQRQNAYHPRVSLDLKRGYSSLHKLLVKRTSPPFS